MNIRFPWVFKKRIRRWDRKTTLSKRQVFVAVICILTGGLLTTQLVSHELRYPMVFGLSVSAYALCAFALRQDLRGIKWLTLLFLPTAFTAAISMFYFLLPVRWLTRIPVALLYGIGMYALLLTENIYNVAAERSIALLRAAHTIGFFLTLATYALLVHTILAFRLDPVMNTILTAIVSYFLIFQSLWAIELTEEVSRRMWDSTITLTFVLAQLAWAFSFMPTNPTIIALFLTIVFYSTAGMAQQYLVDRLYKKTVIEFFLVTLSVFALVFLTTDWRAGV